MKNIILFLALSFTVSALAIDNPNDNKIVIEHNEFDISDDYTTKPITEMLKAELESFAKGYCEMQDSDGVTYRWTVNCFLCSEQRANAKACGELSRLLSVTSLDPAPGCLCLN